MDANSIRRSELHCREMLIALRKIIQTINMHSKDLNRKFGLTGPQLIILQEVSNHQEITVTELSRLISLSQATVTDIVNRLVKRGFVEKKKHDTDKRCVIISPLEKCHLILEQAPPSIQDTFKKRFESLEDWEQLMILSAMERVVKLMSAEKIDASPILDTKQADNG